MLSAGTEPQMQVGGHCASPFGCDYNHDCWKHTPPDSVFDLYLGGKKGWSLYERGILKITDIEAAFPMSRFQTLLRKGLFDQPNHFDCQAVQNIIGSWRFPLYFFDFETLFPAIMVLNGTRPFQQVPFQYTLHILGGKRDADT